MFADRRGLVVDEGAPKVVLPPAVRNAAWPQAGGNPAHLMGHLEANDHLAEAWKADIGDGGGYRKIIMAQPVVLDGTVFTMDSDAVVSAFSMADGKRLWRVDTKPKDRRQHQCRGRFGCRWQHALCRQRLVVAGGAGCRYRQGEMARESGLAGPLGSDDRRRAGVRHHDR